MFAHKKLYKYWVIHPKGSRGHELHYPVSVKTWVWLAATKATFASSAHVFVCEKLHKYLFVSIMHMYLSVSNANLSVSNSHVFVCDQSK